MTESNLGDDFVIYMVEETPSSFIPKGHMLSEYFFLERGYK